MAYQRADFSVLRDTGYGIGFHWTTATVPREGEPKPFDQAVADFDVDAFVEQAVEAGAGHVLFTSTHSRHWMCCPNPEVDRIISGHTCERDLIGDLADGLAAAGIKLIVYYNHNIYPHTPDVEWRQAVGMDPLDAPRYFDNWCRVIGWMGERYGEGIAAWWFDGGYHLNELPDTPWERLTAAAKAGHPGRLVCYNPGIERHTLYTECQDYWAGEVCRLEYIPRGPLTPSGLPWYAFLSWHADSRKPSCGVWVMSEDNRDLDWNQPPVEAVATCLRRFQAAGGTVTFNLLCYQDGSALDTDLAVMRQLKALTRQAAVELASQ